MTDLLLPRRARGRPSPNAEAAYKEQRQAFCTLILEIRSTLDFAVGVRGWCYILEGRGRITKGEFDACESFITACRKTGALPLDICAEDDARETIGLEEVTSNTVEEEAESWIDHLRNHAHESYTPFSFWDDLDIYVEMGVEKLDLRNLFEPVCKEFYVPLTNFKGWSDLNARANMMRRFKQRESERKKCVLLLCTDLDPGGLDQANKMRKNLEDLSRAVGWAPSPENLVIIRFGLDADFVNLHRLTWIDNLETSSGQDLGDRKHPDHFKPYVQDYIRKYGRRKVEANALVVLPEVGRQLCRDAILRHVSAAAPRRYQRRLQTARRDLRRIIDDMLP
jgi:hypothetical protein